MVHKKAAEGNTSVSQQMGDLKGIANELLSRRRSAYAPIADEFNR
jgi:hypothetical protein